jgi:hypothetical protein
MSTITQPQERFKALQGRGLRKTLLTQDLFIPYATEPGTLDTRLRIQNIHEIWEERSNDKQETYYRCYTVIHIIKLSADWRLEFSDGSYQLASVIRRSNRFVFLKHGSAIKMLTLLESEPSLLINDDE